MQATRLSVKDYSDESTWRCSSEAGAYYTRGLLFSPYCTRGLTASLGSFQRSIFASFNSLHLCLHLDNNSLRISPKFQLSDAR